ncbi:hypothetical protein MFIFM68171_10061 [Madurella fahalii]|uniref:Glutamine amidotransferase domain-containing protein n=1 Tax=Madurella fahalii TaxID=1157608 RepID=A0ABQ0GQ28_9PEZI
MNSISKRDRPLRIAILLNSYRSPFITEIRDSYIRSIGAVSHDALLSFFYPAEQPDHFPDPDAFDLIVIGGSNTDPRKKHQWILRVHKFILDVVVNHPGKKLCGICWGHQTISLLFGAEVIDMDAPELGVTEAKLTQAGRRFFARQSGNGALLLQQHHRRAVGSLPNGFSELLAGNQSFLSDNNAILTFQGHPEKDARCAKLRIRDATRWFGVEAGDSMALDCFERAMEKPHHGAEVWERVLEWVREKHSSPGIHL